MMEIVSQHTNTIILPAGWPANESSGAPLSMKRSPFAFHQAEEWINGVFGLWSLISPWAFSFSAISPPATAHIVAGILILGAAVASLWFTATHPYSTA